MLQKLLSYLIPITIYKQKSAINTSIEVTRVNGKLVLDSKNTNYSYGSLQRILKKGLKIIGFKKIQSMQSILVLGVAGGSVIKTLVEEVKYKGTITGVDIDKEVIEVANKYFKINEIKNLNLIIDDAFEFVLKTKDRYDLIVIDVFQDTKMPNFLFEKFFANRLLQLLNSDGEVLFNTMVLHKEHIERNKKYVAEIGTLEFKIKPPVRVDKHNELLIFQKK